jgi:hypothetical protein
VISLGLGRPPLLARLTVEGKQRAFFVEWPTPPRISIPVLMRGGFGQRIFERVRVENGVAYYGEDL